MHKVATWALALLLISATAACAGRSAAATPNSPAQPRETEAPTDTTPTPEATEAPADAGEAADADATEHAGEAADARDAPDARDAGDAGMTDSTVTDAGRTTAAHGSTPGATRRPANPAAAEPAELPVPTLPGALLPATRVVAFYGNPASKHMGILGEVPPEEMLARLDAEVAAWQQADPATPVRPALQMIAVMATGDPGRDSLFRLRMPDSRIRQVARWADRRDALLFLDVQPGQSTVPEELPPLEGWLARPNVHLALDPEWTMAPGRVPGQEIGSMSAADINHAIDFLAELVERYHLPPKILVVHRFTTAMIRQADAIRRDPRVQVVINMDGWGAPPHKRAAYRDVVAPEADQFTGFKIFFHNDRRGGSALLTPEEILGLDPAPIYIQYQ